MDDISRKNFRDYATRVSFNMSLSRNQIAVLRTVRDQQRLDMFADDMNRIRGGHQTVFQETRAELGMDDKNRWVPGARSLISMGLITHIPPKNNTPDGWKGHNPYAVTEAGDLMCQMLELCGLIPTMQVANSNKRKKQRASR